MRTGRTPFGLHPIHPQCGFMSSERCAVARDDHVDEMGPRWIGNAEDVFIHEDRMCITVDISRFTDLQQEEVELNLTSGGEILQLMKTTQMRPLKRYTLPHSAENIVEWDLNNGILDVKFDINSEATTADESE